jgi:hypothetical protein
METQISEEIYEHTLSVILTGKTIASTVHGDERENILTAVRDLALNLKTFRELPGMFTNIASALSTFRKEIQQKKHWL